MYNYEVSIVTIQLRFKAIIILINNFVVSVYTVKTPVLKCIMVERYHFITFCVGLHKGVSDFYIISKSKPTDDHEISGITERIAMKLCT